MSEQKKRYTAQEMRQTVIDLENNLHHGMAHVVLVLPRLTEMVRQAADAEEELTKLHDELKDAKMTCSTEKCPFDLDTLKDANDGLYNEVKSLKARLEAVVKECRTDYDMRCAECSCGRDCKITCGQVEEIVNKRQKDILRAARGEAETENK